MSNCVLKSKSDYQKVIEKVERKRYELLQLPQGTVEYKKALIQFIEFTLVVKAHSYCLDNDAERKKVARIVFECLHEINLIPTVE